VRREELVAQWL